MIRLAREPVVRITGDVGAALANSIPVPDVFSDHPRADHRQRAPARLRIVAVLAHLTREALRPAAQGAIQGDVPARRGVVEGEGEIAGEGAKVHDRLWGEVHIPGRLDIRL